MMALREPQDGSRGMMETQGIHNQASNGHNRNKASSFLLYVLRDQRYLLVHFAFGYLNVARLGLLSKLHLSRIQMILPSCHTPF